MSEPLVQVRDLKKYFPVRRGFLTGEPDQVKAVDGVSFDIRAGETLGLVGESGSGKTTTGRALLRLTEPSAGEIRFDGVDVLGMDEEQLRAFRRDAQVIFQDPFGSLNPRLKVGAAIREVLRVHGLASGRERERVRELLEMVGLQPSHADLYPHEFSGGQRQRIGIARALAVEPSFVVCDEPVSALDVSVQAQVLNLLQSLQERLGLAYLFIAHDLGVVEHVSDRVAVMYLGRIVEIADADDLITTPRHPYTRALLSAVPIPEPGRRRERIVLQGDVPSPVAPPPGCPFHPRCPHPRKDDACTRIRPTLEAKAPGHLAACIKEPGTEGRGSAGGDGTGLPSAVDGVGNQG